MGLFVEGIQAEWGQTRADVSEVELRALSLTLWAFIAANLIYAASLKLTLYPVAAGFDFSANSFRDPSLVTEKSNISPLYYWNLIILVLPTYQRTTLFIKFLVFTSTI